MAKPAGLCFANIILGLDTWLAVVAALLAVVLAPTVVSVIAIVLAVVQF